MHIWPLSSQLTYAQLIALFEAVGLGYKPCDNGDIGGYVDANEVPNYYPLFDRCFITSASRSLSSVKCDANRAFRQRLCYCSLKAPLPSPPEPPPPPPPAAPSTWRLVITLTASGSLEDYTSNVTAQIASRCAHAHAGARNLGRTDRSPPRPWFTIVVHVLSPLCGQSRHDVHSMAAQSI